MVFKWKSSVKETLERPSERQRWPVKTRCSFLSLQWYSEWTLVPWSDVSPGNVHCGAWQPTREIHKANCVKTSGKDGVTSCESWPVDRHRPVVFLFTTGHYLWLWYFHLSVCKMFGHQMKMIPKTEVPTYRQLMIQELHQKRLCPIPSPTIQPREYYAVDYIKNYHFGRVIDKNDSFVQFKFLHRSGGATYHWPRRDDMDRVHLSNIFAGPDTVPHFISGPFEIPEQPAVEKLFRVIRKHTRV